MFLKTYLIIPNTIIETILASLHFVVGVFLAILIIYFVGQLIVKIINSEVINTNPMVAVFVAIVTIIIYAAVTYFLTYLMNKNFNGCQNHYYWHYLLLTILFWLYILTVKKFISSIVFKVFFVLAILLSLLSVVVVIGTFY